ncbi:MAG TPA: DUF86 domain-containing protein [Desulfohalobiaceae bacterium]|nr:DUF86 domain-containing protein [Desulfohalobiaceae bacterium]
MRDLLYEQEIQKHICKMIRILDSYQDKQAFSEVDLLAVERGLQVLVESIIGLCRYVADTCYGIKVSKSREALDEMKRLEILSAEKHEQLQSMIGCRNILVHEYLNIDEMIIQSIVQKKDYSIVPEIFNKIMKVLENNG